MTVSPVLPGPGFGMPKGTDLREYRGTVQRSYERFLTTRQIDEAVRPVVADSWRLSRDSGVNRGQGSPAGRLDR